MSNKLPPAKLIAKAALFNEKGEILILRRSTTDKIRPQELDLVGGSIDEGESPLEAVLREINEEAGLTLHQDDVELAYSATDYFEGVNRVRFLYIGKVHGNPSITLSYEHDLHEWMPLQQVFEQFSHPVWVEGLRYLAKHNLI